MARNPKGHGAFGRARERAVADHLRNEDWIVLKGTSYGVADLAALRSDRCPVLIEVKSTAAGPYATFGPAARESMKAEAARAGAKAVLAWHPPRGKLRFIPSEEWPG
jgi:Holliday junction resolvase